MSTPAALEPPRTVAEARERAAALAPELAAKARAIDEARQVPAEIVERLTDAGLIRLTNPWRYGGVGDYDAAIEAAHELARASGSVGWCYGVWSQRNWMIGLWPDQAQSEYFADGPDVICASAFDPGGATVEVVNGGYELSGRWKFSSGSDRSSWVMLAGMLRPGVLGFLLLPRSDFAIDDTWFVSGLRGTGSKDVVVRGAFVPEHRVVLASEFTEGRVHSPDRPSYRLPGWPLHVLSLTFAVIGMAQGAVDAFVSRTAAARRIDGSKSAEVPATQLRVAEAMSSLDAARSLCRGDVAQMLESADGGPELTAEDRLRFARNRSFANKLAVDAANRIFDASGANGIYDTSDVQRFHRDVHAGSHQPGQNWDTYGTHFGRFALGVDTQAAVRLV